MSRRKYNQLDSRHWMLEHIHTCAICNEKAEYRLNIWVGFSHIYNNLCEKHAHEWERGELYL